MPLDASVVVPTFCRPHILAECLGWLSRQTYPRDRFEVLVVDDSGPENYAPNRELCEPSRWGFRLRYLTTGLPKEVYGVTVARNLGMREAASPLVLYTDDDCYPHPAWVAEHVRVHAEVDRLALTGYRADDPSVLASPLPIKMTRKKCIEEWERSQKGKMGAGDFKTGNASVKKAHLLEVGGFNESMAKPGEYGYTDRELGMRLLANRMVFRFHPDAAVYVVPPDEATMRARKEGGAQERARERFRQIEREFKRKRFMARLFGFFGWKGGRP